MAVWDDHDYGVNDGGGDFPAKEISRKAFLDFFNEPMASDRWIQESGIYTAKTFGDEQDQFKTAEQTDLTNDRAEVLASRSARRKAKAKPKKVVPKEEVPSLSSAMSCMTKVKPEDVFVHPDLMKETSLSKPVALNATSNSEKLYLMLTIGSIPCKVMLKSVLKST